MKSFLWGFDASMRKQVYDFNLLVSCSWGDYREAKKEIIQILKGLGDDEPFVKSTIAQGIVGVRTRLDPREAIKGLRRLFDADPLILQHTLKWVPIDIWTRSDMNSMKEGVVKLRNKIQADEKWQMTVKKRRYTRYHKIEIIRNLADLIDEKVDLENPDKILLIEILGGYAGISVLKPQDSFSAVKSFHKFGQ